MPEPIKVLDNISKHLTRSERAARAAAERSVQRETRSRIRMPAGLNPAARAIFVETRRRLRGLQILDGSDQNALAMYSDILAKFNVLSKQIDESDYPDKDLIQLCQSWVTKIQGYEDRLGLNPSARARLARKKATREPADKLVQLLDDVTDYVNHE